MSSVSAGVPPKYEQLKQMLLDDVRSGKLTLGSYLPPEVELARSLGVGRNTVRRALADLEAQHLLRRVRGRGTMICGGVADAERVASNLIALVLPHVAEGMYASLQSGLGSVVAERAGQMIVCNTEQSVARQLDTLVRLGDQGVVGIVVVPTSEVVAPPHHFRLLRQLRIPLVFCHRHVAGVASPLVGFSGFEVGRMAGRELIAADHRRVAYFATHAYEMPRQYEAGLRDALARVDGELRPDDIHYGQWQMVGGLAPPRHVGLVRAALERMFARADRPTAIFASFDTQALLIQFLLGRMGLSVPGDVSVIGFGGKASRSAVDAAAIKSVVVDEEHLGRLAGSILSEMIDGHREIGDESTIMVPLSISGGESIAPPRA